MDKTIGANSVRVTAYVFTMVALLSAISINCRHSSLSPSETAKAYINYLAEGKIDEAAKLVSSNFANKRGAYGTNGEKLVFKASVRRVSNLRFV